MTHDGNPVEVEHLVNNCLLSRGSVMAAMLMRPTRGTCRNLPNQIRLAVDLIAKIETQRAEMDAVLHELYEAVLFAQEEWKARDLEKRTTWTD